MKNHIKLHLELLEGKLFNSERTERSLFADISEMYIVKRGWQLLCLAMPSG